MAQSENQTLLKPPAELLGISTCTIRQFKDLLRLCVSCGHVLNGIGSTGIGKTQAVQQVAKEMNALLWANFLAHREREEMIGIPFPNDDGKTYRFLVEEQLLKVLEYKGPVIIFLDEFNRADKTVLNAAFTMMEDRMYGSIKLPDNVSIVTCMNPSDEEYLVNGAEKDPAFRRRMCFVNVVADHAAWVDYATNEGKFHPSVIAFIRAKQMYLDSPHERLAGKVAPNPAAWEKVSQTFYAVEKLGKTILDPDLQGVVRTKVAGHVGVATMVQIMEYASRENNEQLYPEDLFSDDHAHVLQRLKSVVAGGKVNIVAEFMYSTALYIATKQPSMETLIPRFMSLARIIPADQFRGVIKQLYEQCLSLGKKEYLQAVIAETSSNKEFEQIFSSFFNAVGKIRSLARAEQGDSA